jgi:hypothetical protein
MTRADLEFDRGRPKKPISLERVVRLKREGYTQGKIAKLLGVSLRTLQYRLAEAREQGKGD